MSADPSTPMACGSDLQARALYQAGRLYELIGVSPGASRGDIKAACRAAQLKSHPDKPGGDTELFKLVDDAAQLLLNDLPSFDGPPPAEAAVKAAEIGRRHTEICHWEMHITEMERALTQATTDREKAAAQKSITMAGRLLEGDVKELRSSREEYMRLYGTRAQEQEEETVRKHEAREEDEARGERMTEQARQKMEQASRERDALRKRCSRKQSTRFPTMPRMDVGGVRREYTNVRNKFSKISQARSKIVQQGMDTTDIDRELEELRCQARAIVDAAVQAKCKAHRVHTTFPRLARTHPMYDVLAGLRTAHRRLSDRLRKSDAREDLGAQDAEILQQAWDLLLGHGEVTPMSVEADRIDAVVR